MTYGTTDLRRYLDYVGNYIGPSGGPIKTAANGDKYIEFSVTTQNARQEHLEQFVLTQVNKAVDPNPYGVYIGPTGGKQTSTYTVILDKSGNDIDLIGGRYDSYYNDLAGISLADAEHATRPGYPTPYLIDGLHFKIDAPHDIVAGQAIAEWAEDWWTWALHAPATLIDDLPARTPLIDETGDFAGVDNDQPVFFIAGDTFFGTGPIEREFQVPEGKPLLIPLLNFFSSQFNSDFEGDVTAQRNQVDTDLATWEATVIPSTLFLEVDGIEVSNLASHHEVSADFFALGPRPQNSLIDLLLSGANVPLGDNLEPSKSTGYWVMIEHLAPGEHTLHFGGSTTTGFSVDVTDTLFVV